MSRPARQIYKEMARFWGKLFAINFALGVATGLTMEFEFGTNWSFYSHYVGDIFGAPLAIEGLMAFFMESTFVGLMLFGWERLSKAGHLSVTYLVALGSNLSALWILVANGFMQDPVGASFNPVSQRMELTSFFDLLFSHDAQSKFVHTSIAGYVTGAILRGHDQRLVPEQGTPRRDRTPLVANGRPVRCVFRDWRHYARRCPGFRRRQRPAHQAGRHGRDVGDRTGAGAAEAHCVSQR